MSRATIYAEIDEERTRQDVEWGGPTHDDEHEAVDWLDFIEKQSQLAEEAYMDNEELAGDLGEVRSRFIKIASLAVAAIEALDRREEVAQ